MNKKPLVLGVLGVLTALSLVVRHYENKSYTNQEVLIPTHKAVVPIVGTKAEVSKLSTLVNESKVIKTLEIDEKRSVKINFPIGYFKESDDAVKEQLKQLGNSKDPIFVLLDSPGGSVDVGNEMISLMQAADGPVYTVCVGLCASMAAVILEHGTKRFALDRSTIMFHDASGGARGSLGEMNSILQFYRRMVEKTNRYIAERSSMKYETFMELQKDNLWIDAEDAKSLNLIDDLVRLK
jgi:ATP-dependent Clp endopeptidase proteolytic subunit ClpP